MDTITLPAAANVINQIKDYSGAFFTEYALGIIGVVMGLAVAGMAVRWLVRNGLKLVKTIFGGGKKRGRRR